jgi:hypothetical protein
MQALPLTRALGQRPHWTQSKRSVTSAAAPAATSRATTSCARPSGPSAVDTFHETDRAELLEEAAR